MMRHALRIIFNALTMLSLVLAIGVVVLRARSYTIHDEFVWHDGPDSNGLVNCDGLLQFKTMYNERWPSTGHLQLPGNAWGRWEEDDEVVSKIGLMGAEWRSGGALYEGSDFGRLQPRYFFTTSAFSIRHTTLAALLCVPTVLSIIGYLRAARRSGNGRCHTCGYDLRATPDRCPECGAVPKLAEGAE